MSENDKISTSIAEALSAIIDKEKQSYHAQFKSSSDAFAVRITKLKNLLAALEEIKRQVAAYDKIDISISPHGHMATVKIVQRSLSISTDISNSKFTIEEKDYNAWDDNGGIYERFLDFDTDEKALRFVMEAVAKHIALQQALAERQNR